MAQKIYFGFPGVGKTTLAHKAKNVVDLDFGHFRSCLGVAPENNAYIVPAFARLIQKYYDEGFNVLTNEPLLIPLVKQFCDHNDIIVVLPANKAIMFDNNLNKANIDTNFRTKLIRFGTEWISDWEKIASKYNIKVVYVKYIEESFYGD